MASAVSTGLGESLPPANPRDKKWLTSVGVAEVARATLETSLARALSLGFRNCVTRNVREENPPSLQIKQM